MLIGVGKGALNLDRQRFGKNYPLDPPARPGGRDRGENHSVEREIGQRIESLTQNF